MELHPYVEKILVSEEKLKSTVKSLAEKIISDYNGEELLVVVILKGSVIFASDLIRELTMPVTIDFMKASSYGSGTVSSGFINIKQDLNTDIEGKSCCSVHHQSL